MEKTPTTKQMPAMALVNMAGAMAGMGIDGAASPTRSLLPELGPELWGQAFLSGASATDRWFLVRADHTVEAEEA